MVLRGDENQVRACFCRLRLRLAATGMEDANDCEVSRQYADPDGSGYSEAEDQRHEQRNHKRPPFSLDAVGAQSLDAKAPIVNGFFNLPVRTPIGSDDPGAP